MKKLLASLVVLLLTAGICSKSLAADPVKGNTVNPIYGPGGSEENADIISAANAATTQFWAIDAYGNNLGDRVTIASGGSFFVGFRSGINSSNPYLFWNAGWNLSTLARAGFVYVNQIPTPENNFVGGIHIDTSANAGNTVFLDFYICKNPIDWTDINTDKWVIKKVIEINVVGGTNTAGGTGGSADFQKPIPDGSSLSITDATPDPLYVRPGGATAKAVDLTVRYNAGADYPITKNNLTVTMALPNELAGLDSYVAKYVNPYTGAVETHPATVTNGELEFVTDHMSTYVIEGYRAPNVPKTGDDTPLTWILALLLISITGLAISARRWRRNVGKRR